MSLRQLETPVGTLTLTASDAGLTAIHWGAVDATKDVDTPRQREILGQAAEQLTRYFAGLLRDFDLPLAANGTPFQIAVWRGLTTIPHGETRSYGDLAAQIDKPRAARAVGAAAGRNPLPIVVPCHRLVGSQGQLTGFAGGLANKRVLLALEQESGALKR